jgi:hypothetical protein
VRLKVVVLRAVVGGYELTGEEWIQDTKQDYYPERGTRIICMPPNKAHFPATIVSELDFEQEGTDGTIRVVKI